ncbi:hypothetical protein E2562_013546 [Oryza meyeriana var. granulata]|uniref:Bifunctional inhibitor/plant lipid transfer protein/seed storage helical domain-containing protein n=1 Tax=Oryza meyeriana var. granulata TaxID=110450 RepID=A0A6G1D3J2_9ORYZ|nr:hypothetical protein E2562_013546 [Oryza meyeriana var. granulata]
MSPSKTILLLAFALVVAAAALPPSAARPNLSGGIIPLPRVLPDPPSRAAPAPVPSPAPSSPAPAQCMPSLAGLVSCIDFLNDYTDKTPMAACCGDFRKLVDEAPICLCHAMDGGDINQMMPEPINVGRLMTALPVACDVPLPLNTLAKCSTEPVPPLTTVPFVPTHP